MTVLRLTLVALLLPFLPVRAQQAAAQAPPADTVYAWKLSLLGSVNGAQAAYSNWTQGGLNSLAVTSSLDGKAERETPMWGQTHTVRLAYGLVKQDTLDVRKADDIIRLETALRYRGDGFFRHLRPTAAMTFRSQFMAGYNYDKNPFKDGRTPPVRVSDFFAPGIFTQAIGLTYQADGWFKQRFGLGGKQTFVAARSLRTLYNLRRDQLVRVEAGLEARTDVDARVAENVRYISSLGLFAAFNRPDVPDVTWDNEVRMKVNSWLSTNLQASLLFDRDQSKLPQLKEVLSVGVSITFI